MIDGSEKKAIVSWLLNLRIRMFVKTVSIKHGLRTGYKIRTRYNTRTGKYGLGIKHGLGIKRGLRTADWV